MKRKFIIIVAAISFAACNNSDSKYDAQGTFEADEVIVSSSNTGKLVFFNVQEGQTIPKDSIVGLVDPTYLQLQKEQVEATISSLSEKTADVNPQVKLLQQQIAVQQSQMDNLLHEKARIENLLKADAATGKQLDDIGFQIEALQKQITVTQQQIAVQKNNVSTQNKSILSEAAPLQKNAAAIQDLIRHASIVNPIPGTVITKYAMAGELMSPGKALYKIADLSTLTLRAYITGTQMAQVKLNQPVKVFIDSTANSYKQYTGSISWISDKAEFTPKTIQTKEERANLVYAIKIKVPNDGYLKIGMYAEVKLAPNP